MCPECYSEKNRITPIYHPYDCLSRHTQYICGTCNRCICIQKDKKRNLYRWNFPFKSLQDAKYYLRTAEYTLKAPCAIYEIKLDKERTFFKIFKNKSDVVAYLKKNKDKKSNKVPVFKTGEYQEFTNTQVRKLTEKEINFYLLER
ncbi:MULTISPECIES: hypothetical protein [Vagococcus]|uniref:hypothetical protein n=1 Tax=Vagococcus TaxID=2737 RepID=UPI002FCA07F1